MKPAVRSAHRPCPVGDALSVLEVVAEIQRLAEGWQAAAGAVGKERGAQGRLDALEAELGRLRAERDRLLDEEAPDTAPGTCVWAEDDGGRWWTACGQGFQFIDGGPVENRQRHCGYCGGELVAEPYLDPIEHDEDDPTEWHDSHEEAL